MRKGGKLVLLITAIALLAGCVQKTDTADITAGIYILQSDEEEFLPQIIIDENDKTFSFSLGRGNEGWSRIYT